MLSVSERVRKFRASSACQAWRQSVLSRDKNKCVLCESTENLEVDHIKPLSLFPTLAIEIDNGRILCKECHKKTDTYGHLSKFKGDTPIHPILSGDLQYRIQTLPTFIELGHKAVGLSIVYIPGIKKWQAGYKNKKSKLTVSDDTLEKTVDKLFEKLNTSSTLDREFFLRKALKDEYMEIESNKKIRGELYALIEKIISRDLASEEKMQISNLFKKSIKIYVENLNLLD